MGQREGGGGGAGGGGGGGGGGGDVDRIVGGDHASSLNDYVCFRFANGY